MTARVTEEISETLQISPRSRRDLCDNTWLNFCTGG